MAAESAFFLDISAKAAADYSTTGQYRFVAQSSGDLISLCVTGSTMGSAGPFGILQNDPSSNQAATVRVFGLSKCVASEGIAAGALITVDAVGQARNALSTGTFVIGRALSTATTSGNIFEVFVQPLGMYSAGASA